MTVPTSHYVSSGSEAVKQLNERYEELVLLAARRRQYIPSKAQLVANGYAREIEHLETMLQMTVDKPIKT